jgi:hypothetical protein
MVAALVSGDRAATDTDGLAVLPVLPDTAAVVFAAAVAAVLSLLLLLLQAGV